MLSGRRPVTGLVFWLVGCENLDTPSSKGRHEWFGTNTEPKRRSAGLEQVESVSGRVGKHPLPMLSVEQIRLADCVRCSEIDGIVCMVCSCDLADAGSERPLPSSHSSSLGRLRALRMTANTLLHYRLERR